MLADPQLDTLTYVDVRVAERPAVGGAAPPVTDELDGHHRQHATVNRRCREHQELSSPALRLWRILNPQP